MNFKITMVFMMSLGLNFNMNASINHAKNKSVKTREQQYNQAEYAQASGNFKNGTILKDQQDPKISAALAVAARKNEEQREKDAAALRALQDLRAMLKPYEKPVTSSGTASRSDCYDLVKKN